MEKFFFEKHPAPKGKCPRCGKEKVFRYYQGFSREYGRCERINSCGYHNKPTAGQRAFRPSSGFSVNNEPRIIYPKEELLRSYINNQESAFHAACKKLEIPYSYFIKWNIGSKGNETAFVFQDKNQKLLNVKFIWYDEGCHRIKDKEPYSLRPKDDFSKYSFCLFGEHLLSDKTICLVESEKTAFIASFFYPQFDWLAIAGRNGLTKEKINSIADRKIFYLPDADKAGRENSSIRVMERLNINFQVIDLFPEKNNGYDLADAIFDGEFPAIKPTLLKPNIQHMENKGKGAKGSLFERVEEIISQHFHLRYNEVSNEYEFKSIQSSSGFKPLNENNLFRFLQHNNTRISLSNLTALLRSDFVPSYNPFKQYFESLAPWNEKAEPDFIKGIGKYVIAKEPERFLLNLKKHLVRCIACALKDDYFNKHAFVLVMNKQNSGKTTLCRWLSPPALQDYFAENLTTDKDGMIALSENFIINLDELATMHKADINSLKSIFSKDKIKIRKPYDRKATVSPRRASFFGSTDRDEFLSDEAGSVRWLCFQLISIDWRYSDELNIDDLWRQAYTLFKSGFKYNLTVEEIRENERTNSTFRISTPELDLIPQFYYPGTKENHDVFFTATDALNKIAIEYPGVKLNHINMGKAFTALGFPKEQERKGTIPIKGYYLNYNHS